MRQLTKERALLREVWERRNKQLKQCAELQAFLRDAELVDSATATQEVFLANDDLGVCVEGANSLISVLGTMSFFSKAGLDGFINCI